MPAAPDVPTTKDVVIVLAGASAALAGLVLVFMGVVVTSIQGFPGNTPKKVLAGYRRTLYATLLTFVFALAGLCLEVAWLADHGSHVLYDVALLLFGAAVVGVVIAAGLLVWTIRS